jgi:hypothetical protein
MRKKILWMLFLVPLVLGLAPVLVSATAPYMYVSPDFMWVTPDKEFSVGIALSYIAKSEYLMAYQLELFVDPDVIRPISWENGPFLESAGGSASFAPGQGFDETTGKLWLFGGLIVNPQAPQAPEGSGVLAIVTFEVVGLGDSDIIIGYNDLVDMNNEYIGTDPPEHGAVHSEYGPELYLRRRGAHGGGAWPEWHVGFVGTTQTLYARVRNYGAVGADVIVLFEVKAPGMPIQYVVSNPTWIDPRNPVDGTPGEVVVSGSPSTGVPGLFTVSGQLYFKAGPYTTFTIYGDNVGLGGEGETADTATKYKVETP